MIFGKGLQFVENFLSDDDIHCCDRVSEVMTDTNV